MDDSASRAIGAKAFVSARLSEMESALDGFPAAILVDECLMVDGRSDAVGRRARALVAHILTEWAATIERDLERFPPATNEVLQTIRQRMHDARDALLRLRSLLHELTEFAPNRADTFAGTRESQVASCAQNEPTGKQAGCVGSRAPHFPPRRDRLAAS